MSEKKTLPDRDLRAVKAAIVFFLHDHWPNAAHLMAGDLDPSPSDSQFLESALALQDEGVIMYEAMLVGAGSRPCLRYAILTHKGMLEAPDFTG